MIHAPDRIRFDDAITSSSDPKHKGREVQKFLKNVNWCVNTNVPLTPAILVKDIQEFPEGVAELRRLTHEGVIYPDLHGYDHGPYAPRSQDEIEHHLSLSKDWFFKHLGVPAVRWVTPHGSDSPAMQAAAAKFNLVIETTEYPVVDQKVLDTKLRETHDITLFDGVVIMCHWWNRGLRLYRMARIIEYQSVPEAIEATRSELTEADHEICWKGWL